jgi:hypothetical protein
MPTPSEVFLQSIQKDNHNTSGVSRFISPAKMKILSNSHFVFFLAFHQQPVTFFDFTL